MVKENRLEIENYIKELIKETLLIDDDEKKYWTDLLSVMSDEQLRKLINIIVLDKKEEVKELNKIMMNNYGKNM